MTHVEKEDNVFVKYDESKKHSEWSHHILNIYKANKKYYNKIIVLGMFANNSNASVQNSLGVNVNFGTVSIFIESKK